MANILIVSKDFLPFLFFNKEGISVAPLVLMRRAGTAG